MPLKGRGQKQHIRKSGLGRCCFVCLIWRDVCILRRAGGGGSKGLLYLLCLGRRTVILGRGVAVRVGGFYILCAKRGTVYSVCTLE